MWFLDLVLHLGHSRIPSAPRSAPCHLPPPTLSRREAAVSSREILKHSQQCLQGRVRAEGCLEQHRGTLGSVLTATEWCWHCLFDHFQAVVMGTETKSAQRFSPCHSEQ